MPTCNKCGKVFPNWVTIDGRKRNLNSRKFCLECSPFGKHNTVNICSNNDNVKFCPSCKQVLPRDLFYKRRGSDCSPYCKRCFNDLCTSRQREMKKKAVQYMGGKCQNEECGYSRYYGALEFHHKDPTKKDPKIRFGCTRVNWERLIIELDKCVMLCAVCHREEHARIKGLLEPL